MKLIKLTQSMSSNCVWYTIVYEENPWRRWTWYCRVLISEEPNKPLAITGLLDL